MKNGKPNILFFGVDSLRRDHMSHYGYARLTTPYISKYAENGVTFNKCFSPHIPTTPGFSNMLTGRDCFGTDVVGLSQDNIIAGVPVLAEILREQGYETTCVGLEGNAAGRGYDNYLSFAGWGPDHDDGRAHKASNLNEVAIPELERLAAGEKPFFLFLRHMDPHSPYLPPSPYQDMFFKGNPCDPSDDRMQKVYDFKPFGDYIKSWVPEGCTNPDYIVAQYDGAIAYMDHCINEILKRLKTLNIEEDTIVVIISDHGETLYDHDCYFDHHGLYECTLAVPFILCWQNHLPADMRIDDYCQVKDVTPTLLELIGIETKLLFEGRSLIPVLHGEDRKEEQEFYITECTWMRKHGWRTPEWKLIVSLEPDFHFKPQIELYNLIKDPEENHNAAEANPEIVGRLKERMENFIAMREGQMGRTAPIYRNFLRSEGPYMSSQEAYDDKYIGGIEEAINLQRKEFAPIYSNIQESFKLNFNMADTAIINPPAVTYISDMNLSEVMNVKESRPQAVFLTVADNLMVTDVHGKIIDTLEACLRILQYKAYPILQISNEEGEEELVEILQKHNIGDAMLCVPYEKRKLLAALREKLPYSRGMLDCRNMELPTDMRILSKECQLYEATALLLSEVPSKQVLRSLQKRFCQVWIHGNEEKAVLAGACGILTDNPEKLYELYRKFPEKTIVRPPLMYTHKCHHITGEYPENSVKAALAAGQLGYDAAEIDIQFTKDRIAVVHHDWDTANLYDENQIVFDSTYDEIKALRRKNFPDEGMDRFYDLMEAMTAYPETPVMIEIKTPAHTNTAEEMVDLVKKLLSEPMVQQFCTCIMGKMPPYLAYVHKNLPGLPLAHCSGKMQPPSSDLESLNDMVYSFVEETKGANAAWNPHCIDINNPLCVRVFRLRGITLYGWTLAWQSWEDEKDLLCSYYMTGADGVTSDWVTEFADIPVDILCLMPKQVAEGTWVKPCGELLLRNGKHTETTFLKAVALSGDIIVREDGAFTGKGKVQVALCHTEILPDNTTFNITSEVFDIDFIKGENERWISAK